MKLDDELSGGSLKAGDRVQLTGPKDRKNTITLEIDGEFHSHHGSLYHNQLIGIPDASVVENSAGEKYLVMRPLLSDYVMSMPRGAAIVYPKDAAQIVSLADIFPGATVLEAGVGSGALTLHLLRAIQGGKLFSFERREEFSQIAAANVKGFYGALPPNWKLTVGDLNEVLPNVVPSTQIDRVVLDMLAPWECVESTAEALKPGGVFLAYVATVTQLSRTAEAIRHSKKFTEPHSQEILVRGWHVEGLAVRPDHRMVAHTGFLIIARRLAPGTVLPKPKRRASKSDYTAEDMNVWNSASFGVSEKSDKILRKKARQAKEIADSRQQYEK